MKIHLVQNWRTLLPYTSGTFTTDFEGTPDEWEKVKKEIVPKIEIS